MSDGDLASELSEAKEEIVALRRRIESLERRFLSLPDTLLLSRNVTVRSLVILGHVLFGVLAIYSGVMLFKVFVH
jgi:hypothetical protein